MKNFLVYFTFLGLLAYLTMISSIFASTQAPLVKTTVAYKKVDGHKILADVYRPDDSEIRPVILSIHGGALIMGNRTLIDWQSPPENYREYLDNNPDFIPPLDILQLAQEKGYAVVSIDYRLAPETKLSGIISDIESAFNWLANEGGERFYLDSQRIVVTGASAGGYLTLITGYRVQPQPKALVSLYGYGDLTSDWYTTPSRHAAHNSRVVTREEAEKETDGTVISDDKHREGNGGSIYLYYRQNGLWTENVSGFSGPMLSKDIAPFEPFRNVTKEFPPTMLIHGTEDTDVPFEQSTMMADQFKEHGVPFIMKPIENGEHGFGGGDRDQILEAYSVMRDFIVEHLAEG